MAGLLRRNNRLWWLFALAAVATCCCVILWRHRAHPVADARPAVRHGDSSHQIPGPAGATPQVGRKATYLPLSAAWLTREEEQHPFLLRGRISSMEGEGLEGAVISLYSSPMAAESPASTPPLASKTSGVDGRYEISLSAPVHACAVVRMDGWVGIFDRERLPESGTITRDYVLRPAMACVEGIVSRRNGRPIQGAEVSVSIGPGPVAATRGSLTMPSIVRSTDSSGRYTLHGLPEGSGAIRVRARGYVSDAMTVYPKAGPCGRLDFRLSEAISFSILVKNTRGEAIAGAEARAQGETIKSSTQGMVDFDLAPDTQPFSCVISAEGYRSATVLLNPSSPPESIVLQDVGPWEDRFFKCRVLAASGEAISGAKGSLLTGYVSNRTAEPGQGMDWISDPSGRFAIPAEKRSEGYLSVRKSGFVEFRMVAKAVEGPGPETIVRLDPAEAGIYGRAVDSSDEPATRIRVILTPDPGPGSGYHESQEFLSGLSYDREVENEAGFFLITDIPAGTYFAQVQRLPVSSEERSQSVQLGRLELRRGLVYGEIIVRFPLPDQSP